MILVEVRNKDSPQVSRVQFAPEHKRGGGAAGINHVVLAGSLDNRAGIAPNERRASGSA